MRNNNHKTPPKKQSKFHLEFKTSGQSLAWTQFKQHDVLFLSGVAGTGKSYAAMAFAINEVLQHNKKRIILTRPIVEAGENLGFLPGTSAEKTAPYMVPLYDCLKKLVGEDNPQRDAINAAIEVIPLAYMRGITFTDAVCIFDEAQNATKTQLKLFLTRFDETSKIVITGDPEQSDIPNSGFNDVMIRLETVPGVGIIKFSSDSIVRHKMIGAILERLKD